jgi:putative DNA primase/helicase
MEGIEDETDEQSFSVDSNYQPDAAAERKRPDLRGRRGDAMLRELAAEIELWRGSDGRGYATLEVNGHREHWHVLGEGFANWLRLRAQLRSEPMLGATDVERLTANLNARCLGLGQLHQVWRRVGWHGGNIYVDLADEQWRAVEIVPAKAETTERWRVIDRPPVRFLRTAGMRAMPVPTPGGQIDDLRRWINVESEAHFRLTIAWVLACYRDGGPFPILLLRGGQGSGKSTLTRLLLRLVDPQEADVRSPPKEERDLWVAAQHARVLAYDNLSSVPAPLADAFCRLSSGGAFATRTLRTNDDETILRGNQPVLLNAIVDLGQRADLADRALLIEAQRLTGEGRRDEEGFWAEFSEEEPLLLGAVFDMVSAALGAYRETPVPTNLRMADAARWAEASAPFLNWRPGKLSEWWRQNRAAGNLVVLESDIVGLPLVAFLEEQGESWQGTTGELLMRLTDAASDKLRRAKRWPINTHQLRSTLDRLREALEAAGWTFDRAKGTRGMRKLTFSRAPGAGNVANPAADG